MATVRIGRYEVGSESITYAVGAGLELAGTTATRFYVATPDGRKVASGLESQAAAIARAIERTADEVIATVPLADGRRVGIRAAQVAAFRGLDTYGHRVIEAEGIGLVAITDCCGADGTGSGGGVACRGCYVRVPDYFGGAATVAVPVAGGELPEPAEDPGYASWFARVDALCMVRAGLSIRDLSDQPFADWYADGLSPAQALKLSLANP